MSEQLPIRMIDVFLDAPNRARIWLRAEEDDVQATLDAAVADEGFAVERSRVQLAGDVVIQYLIENAGDILVGLGAVIAAWTQRNRGKQLDIRAEHLHITVKGRALSDDERELIMRALARDTQDD